MESGPFTSSFVRCIKNSSLYLQVPFVLQTGLESISLKQGNSVTIHTPLCIWYTSLLRTYLTCLRIHYLRDVAYSTNADAPT